MVEFDGTAAREMPTCFETPIGRRRIDIALFWAHFNIGVGTLSRWLRFTCLTPT